MKTAIDAMCGFILVLGMGGIFAWLARVCAAATIEVLFMNERDPRHDPIIGDIVGKLGTYYKVREVHSTGVFFECIYAKGKYRSCVSLAEWRQTASQYPVLRIGDPERSQHKRRTL